MPKTVTPQSKYRERKRNWKQSVNPSWEMEELGHPFRQKGSAKGPRGTSPKKGVGTIAERKKSQRERVGGSLIRGGKVTETVGGLSSGLRAKTKKNNGGGLNIAIQNCKPRLKQGKKVQNGRYDDSDKGPGYITLAIVVL